MIFLDHLGSNGPVGKNDMTSPRTIHIAIAPGTREITGRKQVVKLALTGS
jgi:hypothetical protein